MEADPFAGLCSTSSSGTLPCVEYFVAKLGHTHLSTTGPYDSVTP